MTDAERAHRCFEDWGIRDEPLQARFAKAIGEARAEGFRAGVEAAAEILDRVALNPVRMLGHPGSPEEVCRATAHSLAHDVRSLVPPQESA